MLPALDSSECDAYLHYCVPFPVVVTMRRARTNSIVVMVQKTVISW